MKGISFKVLLSAETGAIAHVAKCDRDALEHPVPRLSPDYVSVNIKELLSGSIPFSLAIVTSESLKAIGGGQTTGSF